MIHKYEPSNRNVIDIVDDERRDDQEEILQMDVSFGAELVLEGLHQELVVFSACSVLYMTAAQQR